MYGGGGSTFKGTELPDNFKDLLILDTVSGAVSISASEKCFNNIL